MTPGVTRSLRKWIVPLAFIALLPAMIGMIGAKQLFEDFIRVSVELNKKVFDQSKSLGGLLQKSSEMERKARLVIIFSDKSLREPYEIEAYERSRSSFLKMLGEVRDASTEAEVILLVQEISDKEGFIHRRILEWQDGTGMESQLEPVFDDFHLATTNLAARFDQQIESSLDYFKTVATSRMSRFMWEAAALQMVALALVIMLVHRVSKDR